MNIFGASYTLVFLTAITLNVFDIMDTAQICVDFSSIGRVCVPDPASEINSDIQFSSITDCPIGKISLRGSCVDINEAFELNSDFGTDIFTRIKEECPKGTISKDGQCVKPNEQGSGGFGGGGIASSPCPQGTRADQHGNCRQELF